MPCYRSFVATSARRALHSPRSETFFTDYYLQCGPGRRFPVRAPIGNIPNCLFKIVCGDIRSD